MNVDVRPMRLAYAVSEGSVEDFQAAVLEASSRWGGIQEPILPVGVDGRVTDDWLSILEFAPVDLVCAVSGFSERRVSLQAQTGRDVVNLEHVQTYAALHATAAQPEGATPSHVTGAGRDDPITTMVALGAAWDAEQVIAWQQALLNVFNQPFGVEQLVGAQINESSLIAATGRQCGETKLYGIGGGPTVVWLTVPDSLDDAMWFWNFRALIPLRLEHFASCLVPVDWGDASRLRPIFEAARNNKSYVYEPDLVVYSHSLDRQVQLDFLEALGCEEYTKDTLSLRPITPGSTRAAQPLSAALLNPIHFVTGIREFGARAITATYLRRSQTVVSVESPVRFRLGGGQVRVRFSGPGALAIPHSPSAANLFERSAVQAQGFVEVTTMAQNRYTFHLDIPDRMSILGAYLHDRGLRYRLSDKGRLASGVSNVVQDISKLRRPRAAAVIDALTTHRFEHELREVRKQLAGKGEDELEELVRGLLNVRQESRTLEQIFSELSSKDASVSRSNIGVVLVGLADAGVVTRGLQTDCHLCGMKSFIDLGHTVAPAMCPGCHAQTAYSTAAAAEPAIHYMLNALVDRASDQGVLGHVVIDGALRDKFGEQGVVNLPGADITLLDGTQREADCLALVGSEIWVGEAKPRSDSFTEEQIGRDLVLAEALGANTYLMACLTGLDDVDTRRALEMALDRGLQLALLPAADANIRILTRYDAARPRTEEAPSPSEPLPSP